MMFVSTTTISLSHSVATFGNSSLDVFRCWDESAAQLHRFGSFRWAHFADGHAFADKVGDRVLKFSMFVYSANLDFAHQLVRQIKRRFHFARFPESWFSVNRVSLAKVPPPSSGSRVFPTLASTQLNSTIGNPAGLAGFPPC